MMEICSPFPNNVSSQWWSKLHAVATLMVGPLLSGMFDSVMRVVLVDE